MTGEEDKDDGRVVSLEDIRKSAAAKKGDSGSGTAAGPMINLPPVTKYLLLVLVGVHLIITLLLSDEARFEIYQNYGFISGYYTGRFDAFGWEPYVTPFTYMLLHGSWLHLVMNSLMLMAFGAGVEKAVGGLRMLVFTVLCGLASILVHFVFSMDSGDPVIGASGAISGLFAAAFMLMQSQQDPQASQRLWVFAGVWVAISVAFGIAGGPDGSTIAWQAHIGGFLAGFLLFKPVVRFLP